MSEKLLSYAARREIAVPTPPHTAEKLGELAATLYLRPTQGGRKMPRELAYLKDARRFVLSTRAGELAAWRWGPEDRPLIGLLHGWEGHGAQLGGWAAPLVAAGFGVVTFDAPGHGESPGEECSAPLMGRVVLEAEASVGRWQGFVAHSMGAAAAAMAATHGAHPRAMVFLAPPLSQLDRIERMARRAQVDPAVVEFLKTAVERRAGLSLARSDMHYVAPLAPCPLLAFHDPEDGEASYADTAGFVAAWRGAHLVPCPGRGHVRLIATPEVIRQGVDFLAQTLAQSDPISDGR